MGTKLRAMVFVAFLLLFAPFSTPLQAQPEAAYTPRKFDPERLRKFREDERFQYDRREAKPKQEIPQYTRRGSRNRFDDFSAGNRGAFGGFAKGLMWTIFIVGGAFLLLQILKVDFRSLLRKRGDKTRLLDGGTEDVEDIQNLPVDDLLQQAIRDGRFRDAVRMLYLRTLRQLTDRALIRWQQEKTNQDYLREIKDGALRPDFRQLTFLYEYIWYGEFPVNQEHFDTAHGSFRAFEQRLDRSHAP